jgi:excisionase family DNA binding protein
MVKQIGAIKLYSVQDLHDSLGINERTIRDWFNKGRLKGQKLGTQWHITEENLKRFLSGEAGDEKAASVKRSKRKKNGGTKCTSLDK